MRKPLLSAIAAGLLLAGPTQVVAENYVVDTKGAHAFIQFRIKHLGYSWLVGRFNTFEGEFSFDEADPSTARISMTIDTTSIDSNHAERDKHLRNEDFLDVDRYPQAHFDSTSYRDLGDGKGELEGMLTLHGVTRPITIDVRHIGAGPDPWGGYRRGFEGHASFALADFGIEKNLGPASKEVYLWLGIEGILDRKGNKGRKPR